MTEVEPGSPGAPLRRLMRGMSRLVRASATDEQVGAVRLFERLDRARDLATAGPVRRRLRARRTGRDWPVLPGAYVVGDPDAPVAVCTLTSNDLMRPIASLPGVAIVGRVYTANLGIERIVVNLTSNSRIRFLLLAGKESSLFRPGQSLRALLTNGIGADGRIIGAEGHLPVLRSVSLDRIAALREQVELIDRSGELDPVAIAQEVKSLLARDPGPFRPRRALDEPDGPGESESAFVAIRPGGSRQPLVYDPRGFFVITLDRARGEIVLRHYLPDSRPGHIMRGRSAEAMALGLVRGELVSQFSHAAYLGAELAKAEAALRLGLVYEQDQPLRSAREGSR